MTQIYSLIIDFPGGLNSTKLHAEIASSAVTIMLDGINTHNDVVEIVFASALGSGDLAIVAATIAAHIATPIHKLYTSVSVNKTVCASDWEVVTVFAITDTIVITDSIGILSKMSGNLTSYDVRFYDVTNNTILTFANFTNSNDALMNTGNVTSAPVSNAIIELHIKVNGADTKVFISEIIYYVS